LLHHLYIFYNLKLQYGEENSLKKIQIPHIFSAPCNFQVEFTLYQ